MVGRQLRPISIREIIIGAVLMALGIAIAVLVLTWGIAL
jgi:hypothetical protein